MGISIACMLHCLALPVVAALLPFGALGSLAENHWHWLFVVLATPVSVLSAYRAHQAGAPQSFSVAVGVGLGLLLCGVLVHDHKLQVALTLAGALTLAAAHLYNLRRLSGLRPS